MFLLKNFFEGKNVFAYQKNKNTSQELFLHIKKRSDAISSEKYGIAVMADLQGVFDTVWRKVPFTNYIKQE